MDTNKNSIIKLARVVNEEEIEYIIPVMEAKFTVVDEVTGFINWDNEDFDIDLTDERIKKKWDSWVAFKATNSTLIMENLEIIDFVQKTIDENLKATQQAHQAEIELIRKENDERTEKIRKEYQKIQSDLTDKMTEATDLIASLADGVKKDMQTINKSAINMSSLKDDFAEISGMFKSILEAE